MVSSLARMPVPLGEHEHEYVSETQVGFWPVRCFAMMRRWI